MQSKKPKRRPPDLFLGSDEWKALVRSGAESMGIRVDGPTVDQFAVHGEQLLRWTRKINLTAVTDPREIAVKHFIDSLAPVPMIPPGAKVIDIGSGGGFPGIPVKIRLPSLQMTLIDSSEKKINFLKHVIRMLAIDGIEARHIRAEELAASVADSQGPGPGRGYDVVLCRAVSSLADIARMALPLMAAQGQIISLKGKITEAELAEARRYIHKMDPSLVLSVVRYTLPFLEFERALVCMRY